MQFEFVWEIEKFMWHSDTMSSPTFNAGRGIWKIKLFPLGNPGSGDKKHVAVYLQLVDLSSRKNARSQGIFATPRFQILDKNSNKVWSEKKAGYRAKERRFVLSSHSFTIFGYKHFISRNTLALQRRFLLDDSLFLRCQVSIREGGPDSGLKIPTPTQAHVDFSQLLTMRKATTKTTTPTTTIKKAPSYADVTFRLDGAEFECHKAIVSKRAPVFKEFFLAYDSDVFEISTSQEFEIELKAPIFQDALLHIYGSSPKILSKPFKTLNQCWAASVKKILSLMLLATKYEIKDLTRICESRMIDLFRARSLGLAKKVKIKKRGKNSGKRDPTDFFHFEGKPFTHDKMMRICEHVTATCLSVYLATCQRLRVKLKEEPTQNEEV